MEPLELAFTVGCPPAHAFAVWTERTSLWWPKSHSVSADPQLTVTFEPREGGRVYERTPSGEEHDWGRGPRMGPAAPPRLPLAPAPGPRGRHPRRDLLRPRRRRHRGHDRPQRLAAPRAARAQRARVGRAAPVLRGGLYSRSGARGRSSARRPVGTGARARLHRVHGETQAALLRPRTAATRADRRSRPTTRRPRPPGDGRALSRTAASSRAAEPGGVREGSSQATSRTPDPEFPLTRPPEIFGTPTRQVDTADA